VVGALKNEAISERFRRWHLRDVLVAAQVTLSVVLLISSLLVLRSLQQALRLNLGFDPERAVSISFDLGLEGYSEDRGRTFQRSVVERVSALPGIVSAGAIDHMPLRFGMEVVPFSIVGRPLPPSDRMPAGVIYSISPGYLTAAGTRLLSGRGIDENDRASSPRVALINITFARAVLQGEEPIGKRFRIGRPPAGDPIEIVGVVEDGKYQSLGEDPTPAVFVPLSQRYGSWTTVVARTPLPLGEGLRAIRDAVLQLDPALTLFNTGTLKDQLALPFFPVRVAVSVLGTFGLIAVVLSATGVFALVAYAVSRRTREIGIRIAMGAGCGQVLRAVLARTLALWIAGSCLGTAMALAASRLLSSMLYGVSPSDPVAYGSALLLMATAALLACWYPAYRAMRVNPALTLRQE
jgi:predicted permease